MTETTCQTDPVGGIGDNDEAVFDIEAKEEPEVKVEANTDEASLTIAANPPVTSSEQTELQKSVLLLEKDEPDVKVEVNTDEASLTTSANDVDDDEFILSHEQIDEPVQNSETNMDNVQQSGKRQRTEQDEEEEGETVTKKTKSCVAPQRRVHGDQNEEIGRVMGFGYNGVNGNGNMGLQLKGEKESVITPTTHQMGEVKFVNASHYCVCSIDEHGKLTVDGKEVKMDKEIKYAVKLKGSVFAIDEDDCLWSWGLNEGVPLGHGHKGRVKEPKQIESLKQFKIKQVRCASRVALCVTMDGRLFVWGQGDMFGFANEDFDSPNEITECDNVKQIAVNERNALLLCSDGHVYSVGSNSHGQLGLGHQNEASGFNKIARYKYASMSDSIDVLKIQVNHTTSAVLTKSGRVYVFGIWDKEIYSTPQLIEGLTNVVDISMSTNHVTNHILALTSKNELFAWGYNNDGECGIGSKPGYIATPTRVSGFEDKEILQISAGSSKSLVKFKTKHNM